MSQLLHSGFDEIAHEPAPAFLGMAPDILDIDELVEAFGVALARENATGHCCMAIDADGRQVVLTQSDDGGRPTTDRDFAVTFSMDMPDDEPLILTITSAEPPDRHRLARLHLLAVVYANHVVTLIEARDDALPVGSLTPIERHCLQLVLAGLSYLDIGDELQRSAPAVGVYLRRAAARLRAGSVREACVIAMDQGFLDQAA